MRIPDTLGSHNPVTRALAVAAIILAVGIPAYAAEIVGRVVSVADGDTVTVLDAGRKWEQNKTPPKRGG